MSNPPLHRPGLARFAALQRELETTLDKLWAAHAAPRTEHPSIPAAPGVYLFMQGGKPKYVGQTRKLRERLRAHTIPSATHDQASFAFLLGKKTASANGVDVKGPRRTSRRALPSNDSSTRPSKTSPKWRSVGSRSPTPRHARCSRSTPRWRSARSSTALRRTSRRWPRSSSGRALRAALNGRGELRRPRLQLACSPPSPTRKKPNAS